LPNLPRAPQLRFLQRSDKRTLEDDISRRTDQDEATRQ
jgi:hypothetical protein